MRMKRFSRLLMLVLAVAASCAARKPGSEIKPGFNLFSKEQDIQLGKEAAAQVRQQYQVVQNRELQDYINRVGQRLAKQPEAGGYPYTFTLLNEKSVNAFALPGGPAFVFTGLILEADNEAQLAGVLAHEISHVALRHGTNQASKANLIQLPAMLAGAMIGNGSMLGQLAQLGIGLGANSVLLKFSRTAEEQADALGARIMSEAGYNPIEMARFFEKLEAQGGSRAPQFLSDHPNPGNRVRAVEQEIQAFPRRAYNAESGDFARIKALVAQLPAPPPPKAPRAQNSPAAPEPPSADSRQFSGQKFRLNYPSNWQVFGDRNSNTVTIAPREGLVQASNGNVSVGYGAMISYYLPEPPDMDLQTATSDLIRRLRAANPGMEVRSPGRKLKVDGSPALSTTLSSASAFGGDETDLLITVSRPEGIFYMVLIAPQRAYPQLQGAFDQMVRSVRFNG
jgi:Zn-dependent protease with chaperone function